MAHELQERYSSLVLAKLRNEIVLKDGIVFNNDYEGDPKSGAVKVPVRDAEVSIGDYNTANGKSPAEGSTTYKTIPINKDIAINEIIDGYAAEAVPDGIAAERLDSGAYVLSRQLDIDGATTLLGGATKHNKALIDETNAYNMIVEARTALSKSNVPNDGRRWLLVTPDFLALLLKSDQFISASNLGDEVKQAGIIGRIAGFNVLEWNDNTSNLQFIAGHPKFATRINEWKVPVSIVNLTNEYIGSSAVQGRMAYGHEVLRPQAIISFFAPESLTLSAAQGSAVGSTIITITGPSGTYKYTVNPGSRAEFGASYSGTALTSGTTEIAVNEGDIVEVVKIVSSKVESAGYITISKTNIKA